MLKFVIILLPMVFLSNPSQSGWLEKLFGYDNFEDCILSELDGVQSNSAANAIKHACRKKFPLKTKTYSSVGSLEIKDGFWKSEGNLRFTVTNKTQSKVSKLLVHLGSPPCEGGNTVPVIDHFIKLDPKQKTQLYLYPYQYVPRGEICYWVEGFSED